MNPIIEKVIEKPLGQRLMIWVGSLLFIALIYWSYFHKSVARDLEKVQTEVEKLESEKTNELRLSRNLKKFKEEVAKLDVQLKFALKQLPDAREIPDLLSSISNLARDSGLEVSLFKTRPEIIKDFYAEVPVEVSLGGNFHQVLSFFDEVGHLNRIVNISDIELKEPKATEGSLLVKTACVATTFRYLDEKERLAQSQGGGDKGKKRRRKGK